MINNLEDIMRLCEQSELGYFKYVNDKEQIVFSKDSNKTNVIIGNSVKNVDKRNENEVIPMIKEKTDNEFDNRLINTISSNFVGILTYGNLFMEKKKDIFVRKGDVLCVVEAMKIYNEIVSTEDCIIEEILVNDGDLVEYGQELFRIRVNACD